MMPSGPNPYAGSAGGGGSAPVGAGGPWANRPELRKEVIQGAIVAVAVAVFGLLLGALWLKLSPRVPLISDGKAVYLKDAEGEQEIGVDGWFTLLGAAFGVVSAVVVFWRCRRGGVPVVFGLAVGAMLGSLLAWRFGILLGPTTDIVGHAKDVGANKSFDGPMKINAKGALLAWPALAMAVHLLLTWIFGSRDPLPAPPAPVPWDGGGAGSAGPVSLDKRDGGPADGHRPDPGGPINLDKEPGSGPRHPD